MKTPVILVFIVFFFNSAYCQLTKDVTWIDVSMKGGFGLSILKNFNISNDDRVNMETFNQCQFLGLKIGTTTAEKYGVYFEADYTNFNQSYNVLPPDEPQYDKQISMQAIDGALLFRYSHFTGAFIEAGARYAMLLGATAYYSSPFDQHVDIKSDFKSSFISLALGAGMKIYQSTKDRYRLNLFTRISYGVTDMMRDPSLNPVKSSHYKTLYTNASKTTPFFLQLGVEFTFYAGYRSATSGKRKNVFGSSVWHFGD